MKGRGYSASRVVPSSVNRQQGGWEGGEVMGGHSSRARPYVDEFCRFPFKFLSARPVTRSKGAASR